MIPETQQLLQDNVGDNVGDAAGMGSDVYESYIVTMLATLLIAALIGAPENFLYPILIGASGMIASIIGTLTIGSRNNTDVMKLLNRSFYVSATIAILLNFVFTYILSWSNNYCLRLIWCNCNWGNPCSCNSKNY